VKSFIPVNLFISLLQGTAIGKCPKDRLFREYIGLELQVRKTLLIMPLLKFLLLEQNFKVHIYLKQVLALHKVL